MISTKRIAYAIVSGALAFSAFSALSGISAAASYSDKLKDSASGLYYYKFDEDNDGTYDNVEITYEKAGIMKTDPNYGTLKEIVIPSEIEGLPVKSIGSCAFCQCTYLKSVTVSKSVINIGSSAFEHCPELTDVTIENPDCKVYDNSSTISNGFVMNGSDREYYYRGRILSSDNSESRAYAKKYDYDFGNIGDKTSIADNVKGDANTDGKLNVRDAAFIAKYLAQGKAELLPDNADFNSDSKVNVRDAAAIAKYLANGNK